MDGEVALLDRDLGPQPSLERLALDQAAARLDQELQDLQGLAGDRHALAVARQPALVDVEDERAEGIGRHRFSRLPLTCPLTFFDLARRTNPCAPGEMQGAWFPPGNDAVRDMVCRAGGRDRDTRAHSTGAHDNP